MKLVKENIQDILLPKSEEDIDKSFKEKYEIPRLSREEIVEKFNEFGVKSKISNNDNDILIFPWQVLSGRPNGNMLNTLVETLTFEEAKKAAKTLIFLNKPWDPELYLKIEIRNTSIYLNYIESIELLSKLINNKPYREEKIIIEK